MEAFADMGLHSPRRLNRRHRPDAKQWPYNPKEMRYYEALDMIVPTIL